MRKRRYVMGIDYGTLSARAVVVDSADGAILSSHAFPYPHGVITGRLPDKAERSAPWTNPVTVLDWWAGNRNILCDMALRGSLLGVGLETRPEHIYLAMLQGIACGTRRIMERCREYGVTINNLVACGGIPCKNPFFMGQYASLLNMPVHATSVGEGPAVGAAIYAATAAGLYESLEQAERRMMLKERITYLPDADHAQQYQALYYRYRKYHDLLGA